MGSFGKRMNSLNRNKNVLKNTHKTDEFICVKMTMQNVKTQTVRSGKIFDVNAIAALVMIILKSY